MTGLFSVVGIVLAASLAYLFERQRDSRSRLHQEGINATVAFCSALEDFRAAQKHRAHDRITTIERTGAPRDRADEPAELVEAVRRARTASWAAYYRVVLVLKDERAEVTARHALSCAKTLETAATHEDAEEIADRVRELQELFVGLVAKELHIEPSRRSSLRGPRTDADAGKRKP